MTSNNDKLADIRDMAKGIIRLTIALRKGRTLTHDSITALRDDGESIANLASELKVGNK